MKRYLVLLLMGGFGMVTPALAADPVPLCVTSVNADSGLKDAGTRFADQVRKELAKDKTMTLTACSDARVIVTVGGKLKRASREEEKMDLTQASGTRRNVTTTSTLSAVLAVPAKEYEVELEGTHLENNMFTMFGSAAKSLAKQVRNWVKDNGAVVAQ